VEHLEFLGSVVRYRVAVGPHFLLVDSAHQRAQVPMEVGTSVNLFIKTEQIIDLPH
jgi:hypothetical protein